MTKREDGKYPSFGCWWKDENGNKIPGHSPRNVKPTPPKPKPKSSKKE